MPWGYYLGLIVLSELIALVGLTLALSLLGGNERRRRPRSRLGSVESGAGVGYDTPAEKVLQAAKERDADLIVLGT
jgi:hypothetical protein